MWSGNISIGSSEAYVEVDSYMNGRFKDWKGVGRAIEEDTIVLGEYDTDIGRIIVNHVELLSGEFTFLGSGTPLIKL